MSDTDCHIIFVWCFLRKSSSMSMSKKHFAPGTDTVSWTSATNTFPESIYQPAPARRFEDQLVVSTNVYINCPCGLMGCHAEYIEVQCWKLGWLFTPQKWAKNWDSGSPTFFIQKLEPCQIGKTSNQFPEDYDSATKNPKWITHKNGIQILSLDDFLHTNFGCKDFCWMKLTRFS